MQTYKSPALIEAGLTFVDKAVLVHRFSNPLVRSLTVVTNFKELGNIAVEMVEQRAKPFTYVTGPMRSGPRSFVENALLMDHVCDWIAKPEQAHQLMMSVFYQLVFQVEIHRIRDKDYIGREHDFIHDLCVDFARPVLHHSLLKRLVAMPGSYQSIGARREYQIFQKHPENRNIPVFMVESLNIPGFAELLKIPSGI